MTSTTVASVDVYIFRRDGAPVLYLLLRGTPGSRFAGLWHTPTTAIAAEETPLTAALRLVTQLGLATTAVWAVDMVHSMYDPLEDRVNLIPVFAVEVLDEPPTLPPTVDASRWNTGEQALTLLRLPGHRDGLRRVHDDISTARDRGAPFRVLTSG